MVERISSTDNLEDPLTKPLAQEVFEHHCTTMAFLHKGNGFSPSGRLMDIIWPISQSHFHVSCLC